MSSTTGKNGIQVIGEGTVTAAPDTLVITLGVITEGMELQRALAQNATAATNVIEGLLQLGINRADIKTIDYRIEPQYRYEDGKQIFQGYRVSHTFEITTKNIKNAGMIVDTAVRNGANSVSTVQFKINDTVSIYQQSLILAARDAQQKAVTLSRAFGLTFHPTPYLVLEESTVNRPVPLGFTLQKAEVQTPITPGKLSIQARIRAYFRII